MTPDEALDCMAVDHDYAATIVRAELERLRAALAEREWRPIESAPRDGTKLLLAKIAPVEAAPEFGIEHKPTFVWWCCQGWWSDKFAKWYDGVEPSGLAAPNFWQPLPEPPRDAT